MEDAALAAAGAGGLQAPNAHLPSRAAWRRQDRAPAPTAADAVVGSQMSRRPTGDSGQSGQEDGWGRRRERAHAPTTVAPRSDPAPGRTVPAHPSGVDPQAGRNRAATPRDSGDAGSGRAGPAEAGLGARM